MITIALRFGEQFSPDIGTISAHQDLIVNNGYVWYGKLGAPISNKVVNMISNKEVRRILLISSGKSSRYWAYVTEISKEKPVEGFYPSYYGEKVDKMGTWFKIEKIEKADKNVMSQCVVLSSGSRLSDASKHSMSPYFIVDYREGGE